MDIFERLVEVCTAVFDGDINVDGITPESSVMTIFLRSGPSAMSFAQLRRRSADGVEKRVAETWRHSANKGKLLLPLRRFCKRG